MKGVTGFSTLSLSSLQTEEEGGTPGKMSWQGETRAVRESEGQQVMTAEIYGRHQAGPDTFAASTSSNLSRSCSLDADKDRVKFQKSPYKTTYKCWCAT